MQGMRNFVKTFLLWELLVGPVGDPEGDVPHARSP